MPRDLFREVAAPSIRVGTHRWYTVPASIAAHTVAVLGVIVVPLLAPSLLPTPQSVLAFAASPPPPPAPPPPPPPAEPPPSPATDAAADVIPDAAPSEALDNFTPEPDRVVSPPRLVAAAGERSRISAGSGVVLEAPPSPQRVYRIGGDIKEPKLLVRVEPTYPAVARAAKMRGPVYVEAIIGKDGRVRDATVTSGVPFAVLREAAIAAVRRWVYTPTTLNGQPVEVQLHVVVQFELR